MKLDVEAEQILLGSLCGDGSVCFSKGYSCRFSEAHSIKQEKYLLWKKEKLLDYFKNIKLYYYTPSSGIGKDKEYVHMQIHNTSFFKKYRDMFYPNGKKKITVGILKKLDWLGIAVWFIDDGSYSYRNNSVSIANKIGCHDDIIRYFHGLGFHPNRDDIQYSFNKIESEKFIEKIKPYVMKMSEDIRYKIGLDNDRLKLASMKKIKSSFDYYWNNRREELIKSKKKYIRNKSYIKLRRAEFYLSNKDIYYDRSKQWALNNPERYREVKRKLSMDYYKRNRGLCLEKKRIFRLKNRDKINYDRRLDYEKNRELYLKRNKEWRMKNK